MHPSLKIVEGAVSPDDEHIALSYGSFDTEEPPFPIVARVSPPRKSVITLELLVDDSTTHGKEIISDINAGDVKETANNDKKQSEHNR